MRGMHSLIIWHVHRGTRRWDSRGVMAVQGEALGWLQCWEGFLCVAILCGGSMGLA